MNPPNDVGVFNVAVCAIILDDENRVLLTQRNWNRSHHPGEWEVPTGRLAQGEGFIEALDRELKEEIDIAVSVLAPINSFHFFRGPEKAEHVGLTLLCRIKSGTVKVDGVEEIDFKWLTLDAALELVKDESIKQDFILAKDYLAKSLS